MQVGVDDQPHAAEQQTALRQGMAPQPAAQGAKG